MEAVSDTDEWRVLQSFFPDGWESEARRLGAFRRARYTDSPARLLRLLLFHAVNDGGLRTTVALAKASHLADVSAVALFKRLRRSGAWLRWLAEGLSRPLRDRPSVPRGLRPRALDSTTIQGPGASTSDWRLHYTLDLLTLACDWHELTTGHEAEALERTPVAPGDVLIGDRAYFRAAGVRSVVRAGGHVLVRMRWKHPGLVDREGVAQSALSLATTLRVGEVGDWPVWIPEENAEPVSGRVVALKLPEEIAERARKRVRRMASKKQQELDPRSLEAAGYLMLFTTLPAEVVDRAAIAELYRYRWQIELAFKRHKQLLRLGELPHKDAAAAAGWILSKLVVALLIETLYRRSVAFSPWGYDISELSG